jgi:uncharacterized protein YfaS (alpha-2-macroglobulin family)
MFKPQKPNRGTLCLARSLPFILILISLACSLPTGLSPTATVQPAMPKPTQTALPPTPSAPLPPGLVESQPAPDVELPPASPITLYFNQAMDRQSVEGALTSQPVTKSDLTWQDDATLTLTPKTSLEPGSALTVSLNTSARSAQGLALPQPLNLTYRVAGYLQLAESLPKPDAGEVDPSSAVVAAFNRPVVPLGADPTSLPAAFTLDPPAQGNGQWLNTSTYIFYPDPALEGGKAYHVTIASDLKSVDGSPLETPETWGFTTASPRLVSLEPAAGSQAISLSAPITLTFNQPMDPSSVEANFSFTGPSGPVSGQSTWNEAQTVLSFRPAALLERGAQYTVHLGEQAQASGGTPLGTTLQSSLQTVPQLTIQASQPAQGGVISPYDNIVLFFSAPIQQKDLLQRIAFDPQVPNLNNWWNPEDRSLHLYGDFAPDTAYTLTVSADLSDPWGGSLGAPYSLSLRSGHLDPNFTLTNGSEVMFLTPQDASFQAQATNLERLSLTSGSLPLSDFFTLLRPEGYDRRQNYQPAGLRSWEQDLALTPDRSQPVDVFLSPDQHPLESGLYFMRLNFPQKNLFASPYLIEVSNIQLTFKISATDSLVWAVDLRDNKPVSGAPVTLYAEDGSALASGTTDADGVWHATIPTQSDPYKNFYAVLGQPGQENFALALSSWSQGVSSWEFDLPADYRPPYTKVYLYTDRPIYRPGQTVYFRAIVRQAKNGRYTTADISSLPLSLYGEQGQELASFNLQLSAYGTGHGQFALPNEVSPGNYSLHSSVSQYDYLNFQVADYRKPEINLQITPAEDQIQAGQDLVANINARYFFDAPTANAPIHWAVYATPSSFSLPGYQVGVQDTSWLEAFSLPVFPGSLGKLIKEGEATTSPDGSLTLEIPTSPDTLEAASRQRYTLEVTIQDESGLPVSARTVVEVNPADFYIGLQPDLWVAQAGQQVGFNVQAVNWEKDSAGERSLVAEFQKVTWIRQEPDPTARFQAPSFTAQYAPVASTDFVTNQQGQARLAFTPNEPGTYRLYISGGGASSELLLWVGGPGQAVWPNLPNQHLQLIADRESYKPGDTAEIIIPNPLGENAIALVSVERGEVMRYQVQGLSEAAPTLSLPLSAEDAPNVYVSVTIIGRGAMGEPEFRQGYLNLNVEPVEETLNVSLTSQPQRAGPGDEVNFEIQVSDSSGTPVEGEFSLSVVDKAVLALADPNSPDILPAFYGQQPLGVRTGLALAAYPQRQVFNAPGLGGGGEQLAQVVRENFPDTAYWNAEIITGPDGKAQVSLSLPDSLTTWQVELRGLTTDTRVGQASTELVTSKELLVRPVVPRFLVVGDHTQLAAVLQNNTPNELQANVSLQGSGFDLDDPGSASQEVSLPAGGRLRLEWWATIQDVPAADLTFSALGTDSATGQQYQDSARPDQGSLPILHLTARQAFRTAGTLDEGGERLELVSLPRSFDVSGTGSLDVELAPSLAAAMTDALDVLEHSPYETSEQTLSRFLPNLELYRALQQFGVDTTPLQDRLNRTLEAGLQNLSARQNPDGGWGWWQDSQSDGYITAYILFGLIRARDAGATVSDSTLQRAVEYLQANEQGPDSLAETWQLDRLAFEQFALSTAGAGNANIVNGLYQMRQQLDPWSQALLALTLEHLSPGSEPARTLISDLESAATRSAAGAHWELKNPQAASGILDADQQNLISPLANSALVVYALAQRDPGSALLPDAVRFLMANRQADGSWRSTYSTAWTLMALSEVVKGTGELGGDFSFEASLNEAPLASGDANGPAQLTPITAAVPLNNLMRDYPNALKIERQPGPGRLYYTAALEVSRPVADIAPLDQGINLSRAYYPAGSACADGACAAIQAAQNGEQISVRLTLNLPHDAYHLVVQDYIPAGSEILDTSLKTSQMGTGQTPTAQPEYDPRHPFAGGWGWWYFHRAQIYDDHIAWAADFLPAGTYELTYTLVLVQPGSYQVLPARAWQFYFPEVQGNSAGNLFEIRP